MESIDDILDREADAIGKAREEAIRRLVAAWDVYMNTPCDEGEEPDKYPVLACVADLSKAEKLFRRVL